MRIVFSSSMTVFFGLALTLFCGCQSTKPPPPPKPISFAVFGGGPHDGGGLADVKSFLTDENQRTDPAAFLVHLGNVLPPGQRAKPKDHEAATHVFTRSNRIPMFIIPGSREWQDLTGHNRDWKLSPLHEFERRFARKTQWPESSYIARQVNREENFAFVREAVLFIGINNVRIGPEDAPSFLRRLDECGAWIKNQFVRSEVDLRAAVIFAHSTAAGYEDRLLLPLRQAAAPFAKPVLFIHSGEDKWFIKEREWETNIQRIQMLPVSAQCPILRVTATLDVANTFQFTPPPPRHEGP